MTRPRDPTAGYEAVADEYIALRDARRVGASVMVSWASRLPVGATVLDLGCGHGVPVTEVLVDAGLGVYAVDASPTMVDACRQRFPPVEVVREDVETSRLFDRRFDGVVAVGLMFLLPRPAQQRLVRTVAAHLHPGGRFVFTAPAERCEWSDVLTGHRSRSLGTPAYRRLLTACGLSWGGVETDEGGNVHHHARRPTG